MYCIIRKCFWKEGQQVFKVWLCFFLYSFFPVRLGQIALCLEHVPSIYKDGRSWGSREHLTFAVTWNTVKCDKWTRTQCMNALCRFTYGRRIWMPVLRSSTSLILVLEPPKLCDRVIWTSDLFTWGFSCIMVMCSCVCIWQDDMNPKIVRVIWTSKLFIRGFHCIMVMCVNVTNLQTVQWRFWLYFDVNL